MTNMVEKSELNGFTCGKSNLTGETIFQVNYEIWVCNKLKGKGILDVQGIENCLIWQSKLGKQGSW